tara:strand:+ start:97 stop:879 length:783 start_codon:yes stop_codon:yes gene_type:complete
MYDEKQIIESIAQRISVNNDPFPYFFIDNFLPTEMAKKAEQEFNNSPNLNNAGNERYQKTKLVFNKYEEMPPTIKDIVKIFYSKNFLKVLENKFNLKNLEPDWTLQGGGMHQSFNGGFLKVHSDFIYKRKSKQRRVLNLLLYLNSNWKKEWNGSIELWDKEMNNLKFSAEPLINNALVFRTDKDSNHGFPEPITCPSNESRTSIALYYYTKEKSFFPFSLKKRQYFHAVWKARPSKVEPTFSDENSFFKRLKDKFFYRLF